MYKHLYSKFLKDGKYPLHFAAHSHHYWPDVTLQAQTQYWLDSAKFSDEKWKHIFSEILPQTQSLLADFLKIGQPEQLVFAPNTHEFVMRLLSCLDPLKEQNILTTNSEFYSFDRQLKRSAENPNLKVHFVDGPATDFSNAEKAGVTPWDFTASFKKKLLSKKWDFIFLSHGFFNSGIKWTVSELSESLIAAAKTGSIVAIDGYHSFAAAEADWGKLSEHVFLIGGSYKYLQGGEGACFITVPTNCRLRPAYTGWFAEIGSLSDADLHVGYPQTAQRFAGSTADHTAIYRLRAVLELFHKENITASSIHNHVQNLQKYFIEKLMSESKSFAKISPELKSENLIHYGWENQGHFLTFNFSSTEPTTAAYEKMKTLGVLTDSRKNRLRFGFGMYQDQSDVEKLYLL